MNLGSDSLGKSNDLGMSSVSRIHFGFPFIVSRKSVNRRQNTVYVRKCSQVFAFERSCWWIHFLLHSQIELNYCGNPASCFPSCRGSRDICFHTHGNAATLPFIPEEFPQILRYQRFFLCPRDGRPLPIPTLRNCISQRRNPQRRGIHRDVLQPLKTKMMSRIPRGCGFGFSQAGWWLFGVVALWTDDR